MGKIFRYKGMEVEILVDSIGPFGSRLTTFRLRYQRFFHVDLLTHRDKSRNGSSSRARPTPSIIAEIEVNPARPVVLAHNQRGMQAGEVLSEEELTHGLTLWDQGLKAVLPIAKQMDELKIHKQWVNRILEPWSFINVILSGTDWGNMFNLRASGNAQPEFGVLTDMMIELYFNSAPVELTAGEWHLPYILSEERELPIGTQLASSTARCARVSYATHGTNKIDLGRDQKLHDDMIARGEWSPFEHAAKAMDEDRYFANFRGWLQYRKSFANEVQLDFDYTEYRRRKESGELLLPKEYEVSES